MGYYHTLRCVAIIKSEYIEYMASEKLNNMNYTDYDTIIYKDFCNKLQKSSLVNDGFYPKMDGDKCIYETSRKVTTYNGNLVEDFKLFMVNVIAPISTIILHCEIIEEPFAGPDIFTYYTDKEVREFATEPYLPYKTRRTISNTDYKLYFG